MKRTCTNGEIFTMAQILFGNKDNEGLINKKNLRTRMAVRQALKFNYTSIMNAYNTINEMVQDIIREQMEEFYEEGKATKDEDSYQVKDEYLKKFFALQEERLNELSVQTTDIELTVIPEKEYIAYANQNDGELTEIELDVLEEFVDFEKKKNQENEETK